MTTIKCVFFSCMKLLVKRSFFYTFAFLFVFISTIVLIGVSNVAIDTSTM